MPVNTDPPARVLDPERLAALDHTGLLDSPVEAVFDRYTRLACRVLQVPVSLVSLVDRNRQFFKSHAGLPEPWASRRETPLSHSFCQHVVGNDAPLVVEDAPRDARVCDNLAVRDLSVVAYLGIPLRTHTGQVLGSFCAIDVTPRPWQSQDIEVLQDLAAAVADEIQLRSLAQRTLDDYHHLQALEIQRDELVHLLVHDLRNPLGSLMAGLELIRDGDPVPAGLLNVARTSGRALLHMVDDILEVSRSESQGLALHLSQVDPLALITEAVQQVTHLASLKRVSLDMHWMGELPHFQGDGEKLRRVLVNLLANGIQHAPGGGEVRTQVAGSGEMIAFSVADSGEGIPPEVLGSMFDKFIQSSTRRLLGGSSGLGLYFCKLVADAHGGRIGAYNSPEGGAVLRLEVPIKPPVE